MKRYRVEWSIVICDCDFVTAESEAEAIDSVKTEHYRRFDKREVDVDRAFEVCIKCDCELCDCDEVK